MNTARKAAEAERFVDQDLEARGFTVVGSLRHVKGAGDHVAVHPGGVGWLVETKCIGRKSSPFSAFSRDERQEMREALIPLQWKRMLAVVRGSPGRFSLEYIAEADWP
jgi:hypothetical protein